MTHYSPWSAMTINSDQKMTGDATGEQRPRRPLVATTITSLKHRRPWLTCHWTIKLYNNLKQPMNHHHYQALTIINRYKPSFTSLSSVISHPGCHPWWHLHQVLAVDFHPRGTVLATASDDHSVRVWDLRKRRRQCRWWTKDPFRVAIAVNGEG